MPFRTFVSIAHLVVFAATCVKVAFDPDSALIGAAIVTFGWVATKIIDEGFTAVISLVVRHFSEKGSAED